MIRDRSEASPRRSSPNSTRAHGAKRIDDPFAFASWVAKSTTNRRTVRLFVEKANQLVAPSFVHAVGHAVDAHALFLEFSDIELVASAAEPTLPPPVSDGGGEAASAPSSAAAAAQRAEAAHKRDLAVQCGQKKMSARALGGLLLALGCPERHLTERVGRILADAGALLGCFKYNRPYICTACCI